MLAAFYMKIALHMSRAQGPKGESHQAWQSRKDILRTVGIGKALTSCMDHPSADVRQRVKSAICGLDLPDVDSESGE